VAAASAAALNRAVSINKRQRAAGVWRSAWLFIKGKRFILCVIKYESSAAVAWQHHGQLAKHGAIINESCSGSFSGAKSQRTLRCESAMARRNGAESVSGINNGASAANNGGGIRGVMASKWQPLWLRKRNMASQAKAQRRKLSLK
jgi:hypothetical protein